MIEGYAVWLYGSWARGDRDAGSDIDILIVGPAPRVVLDSLPVPSGKRRSVSRYSWAEIDRMASYGSMFLHHVRLEGRALLEADSARGELLAILTALGPYTHGRRDVRSFRLALEDVERSIAEGGSPVFEMSILATLARHASILGCFLRGTPRFGRFSPAEALLPALGFDAASIDFLRSIYGFRLHAVRGAPLPFLPSDEDVCRSSRLVGVIIDAVEREVNTYEGSLSGTAQGRP